MSRPLPIAHSTLAEILAGRLKISATVALRIAKALEGSLHHVLTGEALPPGTCRHCGRSSEEG